ncbi:hypothetical protein [Stutzerimonas nitrititolerans]|uniref:hypothetical protein n=1 Tax=Stutzerimonas nitrititolerans TaxID=2482751 RepID=UPI0028B1171D|nr:hypothetical protein [Stutzerimonas nitrititolerans]
MQQTDKAVAEFEAWWDRQPHREQFEDVKDQMRNVWLASRRELVIDLASAYRTDEDGFWVIGRTEARRSIEAAGVKVKE